jgi:hypothetical protein
MEKFSCRSQAFAYFADFVGTRAVASAAEPGAVRVELDERRSQRRGKILPSALDQLEEKHPADL